VTVYAEVVRVGQKWRVRYIGDLTPLPEMNPNVVRIMDLTGISPVPEIGWTFNGTDLVPDSSSQRAHIRHRGVDVLHELPDDAIEYITGPEYVTPALGDNVIKRVRRMNRFFSLDWITKDDPRLEAALDQLVTSSVITAREKADVLNS